MPSAQQIPQSAPSSANGESTLHDLFVLTDEQILEIEPEAELRGPAPAVISSEARNLSSSDAADQASRSKSDSSVASLSRNDGSHAGSLGAAATSHQSRVTSHDSVAPPPWLAAQMTDPWTGAEAKELWNGVQQARQEAAAYRAAFATPEDARALKELYPGGVNEARATAERARLLEDIDRAYFGAAGGTPEQTSAARADLAQRMLREDPAAFREMVFAGLHALEEAEKGIGAPANAPDLPRLAQVFAANAANDAASLVGARHAVPASGNTPDAHMAAYASFEKAANEDLEHSVGAVIERTLQQALPNLQRGSDSAPAGARSSVPLQDRLTAAVRQDVEAALKGDRQLGEQIAQILSARRFDDETRAQVVRLIDDRARQLVPGAARRVINDWTQATLAAHRGNAARADAASTRREVEPVVAQGESASPAAFSSGRNSASTGREQKNRGASPRAQGIDYRKLSDEQILNL